jgi:hypothetical protein
MSSSNGSPTGRHPLLWRVLSPLVLVLAVLVVLMEATIWRWLTAIGYLLARLPIFAVLERLIERLSPTAVVIIFVVPFIPFVPLLKLSELWLLEHHHFIWAAVLIVSAKVLGAAFSTRVFAIARPKMLQVRWFARIYGAVMRLVELGHAALARIPGWVRARDAIHHTLDATHGAMRRLWSAFRAGPSSARLGPFGRRLAEAMRRVRRWHLP